MDVTMPQLGETVTEGTITKWFKQVGDQVAADEPLFEVSTDKVDSEVPSPAGRLRHRDRRARGRDGRRRRAARGDLRRRPARRRAAAPAAAPAPAAEAPRRRRPRRRRRAAPPAPAPAPPAPRRAAAPRRPRRAAPPAPAPAAAPRRGRANGGGTVMSPVVRRLIDEHGLDPAHDPRHRRGRPHHAQRRARRGRAPRPGRAAPRPRPRPAARRSRAAPAPPQPGRAARAGDEIVPFDNIRRRTAEHMVRSKATSAHVYTSVRVDFERVERVRRAHQARVEGRGGLRAHLPAVHRRARSATSCTSTRT